MSGHLFFADRYFGYDDAIYASLRLLEILAKDPRPLGEMLADVPKTFATPELRVDCPDAIKFDVVARRARRTTRARGTPVRRHRRRAHLLRHASSDPAWGLVRASNTGPGPRHALRGRRRRAARRDPRRGRGRRERRARAAREAADWLTQPRERRWTIESLAALGDRRLPRARHREPAPRRRAPARARARHRRASQLIVDAQARRSTPDELARFRELVKRRRAREPIAYLLRRARVLRAHASASTARVLIPRPGHRDARRGRARAHARRSRCRCARSTSAPGSGCVAITLARERPTARVFGADVSADALAVARDNALRLGAYNVAFAAGRPLRGRRPRRRASTSSPRTRRTSRRARSPTLMPDVRDFEPRLALDGGADGLALVRRIVDGAPAHLARRRRARGRGRRRAGGGRGALLRGAGFDASRGARATTRASSAWFRGFGTARLEVRARAR